MELNPLLSLQRWKEDKRKFLGSYRYTFFADDLLNGTEEANAQYHQIEQKRLTDGTQVERIRYEVCKSGSCHQENGFFALNSWQNRRLIFKLPNENVEYTSNIIKWCGKGWCCTLSGSIYIFNVPNDYAEP